MQKPSIILGLVLAILTACLSCGSGGSLNSISGQATVDGSPVDVGTIRITPASDPESRGSGGPIIDGQFQVTMSEGLEPGSYSVAVQASRKTGRTVKDPQRGEVPEILPLVLADSPKPVELNVENANNLQIDFTTRKN